MYGVFFFYILAALTKLKTTEQIYVQSSISFKETTMSLTKASLTYTSYILLGVGAAIFILLFIIVIQLCKRSKSARMSNSGRRTHDASNELRELHVRNMKPSNKGKFNQSVEAEYYQIDEQCEMEHSPAVLRISQKYEKTLPTTETRTPLHTPGTKGQLSMSSTQCNVC